MRLVAILGVGLLSISLSGCGLAARKEQQERAAALQNQFKEAIAGCNQRFPPNTSRQRERARCINEAMNLYRGSLPYPDLLDQEMAARSAIAEQVDTGKMTLAQGDLEFSRVHSNLVAEEQRRALSGRAVSAQESAAAAAWRASNPVTCTRSGNSTTCF